MVRPATAPATVRGYIPPAPPRALIVASDTASFAATVVSLGVDVDRAYRAITLAEARAKQQAWAKQGKASVILALDGLEGVETDDPADEGATTAQTAKTARALGH